MPDLWDICPQHNILHLDVHIEFGHSKISGSIVTRSTCISTKMTSWHLNIQKGRCPTAHRILNTQLETCDSMGRQSFRLPLPPGAPQGSFAMVGCFSHRLRPRRPASGNGVHRACAHLERHPAKQYWPVHRPRALERDGKPRRFDCTNPANLKFQASSRGKVLGSSRIHICGGRNKV